MALGTTELSARSTLWGPTSTPLTSSTSSNSEASSTCTSRNRIGSSGGTWLSSRCCRSFRARPSSVPARRGRAPPVRLRGRARRGGGGVVVLALLPLLTGVLLLRAQAAAVGYQVEVL